MSNRKFHVTIEGLDDDVVVWEGVISDGKFGVNIDGEAMFVMINPDPKPIVEQIKPGESEFVDEPVAYTIHSANFSNVEVTPVDD